MYLCFVGKPNRCKKDLIVEHARTSSKGPPVRSLNGNIIYLVDLSDASQQRVTLCWDAPNIWSFSIFSCKYNQSPFHIKLEKAKIWYTPNFICHLIYYFPIFSNINHINHTSESYYEQMFASTNIKNTQMYLIFSISWT